MAYQWEQADRIKRKAPPERSPMGRPTPKKDAWQTHSAQTMDVQDIHARLGLSSSEEARSVMLDVKLQLQF